MSSSSGLVALQGEDDYEKISFTPNSNPQTLQVDGLSYDIPIAPDFKTKLKTKDFFGKNVTKKTILQNVNLKAVPGRLYAILGSSGSGKTTLLDIISGRSSGGSISGDITLNGKPISRSLIKKVGAYVTQEDRFLPNLTVRETLTFVANMKFPSSVSAEEKAARVETVIGELGLKQAANTLVGGESVKGISGGERRRVSIGCQLLLDPSILFLDEPTSGLDSFTALYIIETLLTLARSNRTVITTIHSPRHSIFHLFDDILLLSQGQTVYNGAASDMVSYFSNLGYACPDYSNPCDFLMDLITVDHRTAETGEQSLKLITELSRKFQEKSKDEPQRRGSLSFLQTSGTVDEPINGFLQFKYLYLRNSRNLLFGYRDLLLEFIFSFVMSLIFGFIYWDLNYSQASINDRFGMFFMMSNLYPFNVILATMTRFHSERPSYYVERQDGLYRTLPFYFARLLSELPFNIFFGLVYTIPAYWMAGFENENHSFVIFVSILILSIYTSRSIALAAISLVADLQQATVIANLIFSFSVIPSGFLANIDKIWVGLRWISEISFLRHTYEALSVNEFTGKEFECDGVGACLHTGEEALAAYSLGVEVKFSVLKMIAVMLCYRIAHYVFLRVIPQKPIK